jgi:hypothetical protein
VLTVFTLRKRLDAIDETLSPFASRKKTWNSRSESCEWIGASVGASMVSARISPTVGLMYFRPLTTVRIALIS